MTIERRLEQVEQQNQQMQLQSQKIQRTNKRLTVALSMTVVAMAAVVTMAATVEKNGDFDTVTARKIVAKNDAGDIVVALGADPAGDGYLMTISAKTTALVSLSSTMEGNGMVTTYQPNGKELVRLGASDNGGMFTVSNNTGEGVAQMGADELGNGVVGAYNRKGKGRTLQPGP
jgi:hypothetical protein